MPTPACMVAGGAAAVAAASCVPSPGVPHPLPPLLTALGPPPQRHSGACKATTGWTPLQRATSVWHRTSTRNVERAVGVTTNTTTATLDRVAATPPAQDACTGRQAASHDRNYTDEAEPSTDPLKTPSTPSTRTAQGHASPWPGEALPEGFQTSVARAIKITINFNIKSGLVGSTAVDAGVYPHLQPGSCGASVFGTSSSSTTAVCQFHR